MWIRVSTTNSFAFLVVETTDVAMVCGCRRPRVSWRWGWWVPLRHGLLCWVDIGWSCTSDGWVGLLLVETGSCIAVNCWRTCRRERGVSIRVGSIGIGVAVRGVFYEWSTMVEYIRLFVLFVSLVGYAGLVGEQVLLDGGACFC